MSSSSSTTTVDSSSSSSSSSSSTDSSTTPTVLTDDDHREVLECARYGEADDLKELLKLGCNVNYTDDNGNTALHKAAANGTIDIATILYDYHAQYVPNLSGNTPLHFACLMGHKPMVEWLLNNYGNSIDIYVKNHFNRSPFTEAINSGHEEIARLLLNHKSADMPKGFGSSSTNTGESGSSSESSGNGTTFTEEEDDVNDEDADLLDEEYAKVQEKLQSGLNLTEEEKNSTTDSRNSNAGGSSSSSASGKTDSTENK